MKTIIRITDKEAKDDKAAANAVQNGDYRVTYPYNKEKVTIRDDIEAVYDSGRGIALVQYDTDAESFEPKYGKKPSIPRR